LLFIIAANTVNAQYYFNGFTGYSVATDPLVIKNTMIVDTMASAFNTKFSYGKGMNLGFGAGYFINDNLAVELNCNTQIFTASEQNYDWSEMDDNATYYYYFSGLNGYAKLRNFNIQLSPLVIYTVKIGKVNPYIKAGVNILYSVSKSEKDYTSLWESDKYEVSGKDIGGITLGFRGSCGVSYQLKPQLQVYGEFLTVITNYRYKKSELLVYNVNGTDQLSTVEEKVTKYKDDEGLIDYSQVGINFGIRYFFKKPEK